LEGEVLNAIINKIAIIPILEPKISAEQFQEFKESEPKESWIKRNLFGFIGALGTIISSVVTILGWLSGALGWFG